MSTKSKISHAATPPDTAAPKSPVHFIGIGGSGMAGLAELALARGLSVSGSDVKTSPVVDRLVQLGAKISLEHAEAALGEAATVVYSSAIKAGNVELQAARQLGLNVLHRADFLAWLMQDKKAITIAGTHGKSTTAAMIAHMLDDLGLSPSVAIGGTMRRYGSAAHAGDGAFFVAEADESDGSFSKYRPYIGVVTNIAFDHMEYFKDQAGLESAFRSYLGAVDPEGAAVIGWDNPLARTASTQEQAAESNASEGTDSSIKAPKPGRGSSRAAVATRLTYGFVLGSEVRGIDYQCSSGETTFKALVERDKISCTLPTMGRHNVQNALCALAVARALKLDIKRAAASLAGYTGVDRRMTQIYAAKGIFIFDDYAHNPGKIAACVQTLREAWPTSTLHVVYQPHRYSRLETMYADMLGAVKGADVVHVVPVYSAGETTTGDYSPRRLAEDLTQRLRIHAIPCDNLETAAESVARLLQGPSVVLTVGAGDVWRVAQRLAKELELAHARSET